MTSTERLITLALVIGFVLFVYSNLSDKIQNLAISTSREIAAIGR